MSVHHLLDHPTSKHIKVLFTDRAHTWIPHPLKCTQGTNGDQGESGAIEQLCQRWPQSLPQMEDRIVVWFWVLLVSACSFYLLTVNPPRSLHKRALSAQINERNRPSLKSAAVERWRKMATFGFVVTHACLLILWFWTRRESSLLSFNMQIYLKAFIFFRLVYLASVIRNGISKEES